ncbi:MAG: hypothetical protein WDO16_06100 [Bacteroidota bacterium]
MARKLTDLIRGNPNLNCLPLEMACEKIYTLLAESIKEFEVSRLNSYQQERLEFYKISTTSTNDFYVSDNETPDKNKCWNLIRLIEIVLKENIPDNHTEKWTTIRDFWYRVHKRSSVKGNSNVERVLDPIARLCGFINLYNMLEVKFRDKPPVQEVQFYLQGCS